MIVVVSITTRTRRPLKGPLSPSSYRGPVRNPQRRWQHRMSPPTVTLREWWYCRMHPDPRKGLGCPYRGPVRSRAYRERVASVSLPHRLSVTPVCCILLWQVIRRTIVRAFVLKPLFDDKFCEQIRISLLLLNKSIG